METATNALHERLLDLDPLWHVRASFHIARRFVGQFWGPDIEADTRWSFFANDDDEPIIIIFVHSRNAPSRQITFEFSGVILIATTIDEDLTIARARYYREYFRLPWDGHADHIAKALHWVQGRSE